MQKMLQTEPKTFFMSLRDLGLWMRSAQADANFRKLRSQHGARKAFDLLYEQRDDPYGATLDAYRYQKLKYEKLLAFLPHRRYGRALDVGCGLGGFSRRLSGHAGEVLGIDVSEVAIQQARKLSENYRNLRFEQVDLAHIHEKLDRQFDLVVMLDVLYYLSPLTDEALKTIARLMQKLLLPEGILLLAHHYFFCVDAASRQTRKIHDAFRWTPSLGIVSEYRRPFYLASVLEKIRFPAVAAWVVGNSQPVLSGFDD